MPTTLAEILESDFEILHYKHPTQVKKRKEKTKQKNPDSVDCSLNELSSSNNHSLAKCLKVSKFLTENGLLSKRLRFC